MDRQRKEGLYVSQYMHFDFILYSNVLYIKIGERFLYIVCIKSV